MGVISNLVARWWWGGDPDELNPVSGMTRREVHAVQSTWPAVHADATKYGMELFGRLFRADPETKTFFKAIRDLSEEQLTQSYQFKAHVINLMSAIDLAVCNLQQPEVVVVMMEKLGESHGKRLVKQRHFNETKDVLVGILKKDLKLNEQQIKGWDSFVNFIYKHIFSRL